MYIFNERETEIINSNFVNRFCIVEKPDASLILASYGPDMQPVIIGRYKCSKEAHYALDAIFTALTGNQTYLYMPLSSYYDEEIIKKDARVKRKGGS